MWRQAANRWSRHRNPFPPGSRKRLADVFYRDRTPLGRAETFFAIPATGGRIACVPGTRGVLSRRVNQAGMFARAWGMREIGPVGSVPLFPYEKNGYFPCGVRVRNKDRSADFFTFYSWIVEFKRIMRFIMGKNKGSYNRIPYEYYFISLVFCILCRFLSFGNPVFTTDEAFYLFVGGEMLHGSIPFVDIWDRKPLGLFILYEFFHLFGPYRVWAYQVGALISVWLTSLLIMKMARTVSSRAGALVVALIYIAWLNLAGGERGQSPVFYDLPVSYAMLHIVQIIIARNISHARIIRKSCIAMLLFGLSMQIKYTTVFEGCFAGIYLLYLLARNGFSWPEICKYALAFATIALLPTALVGGIYGLCGYGHAWWFANMVSIFQRGKEPANILMHNGMNLLLLVVPLFVNIILQKVICKNRTDEQRKCDLFFNAWSAVSIVGILSIGGWYNHYAIPAFLPLSIASAPLFTSAVGKVWLPLLLLAGTIQGQMIILKHRQEEGNGKVFREVLNVLSKDRGCLFIYNGSTIFYDFYQFCKLTDHPFPGHFHSDIEKKSTGMDPAQEIDKVLSQKPMYIMSHAPANSDENETVRKKLYDAINRNYAEVYKARQGKEILVIYKKNI
ncbi:ArnT family glycosyltransferase [Komagataeibacter kakiaceti]